MTARAWPGLVAGLLALGGVASAEDYRHGRVLEAEPGVVIQTAAEAASGDAVPNMPFLPGDRVWTTGAGRAEFQFADGTLVRLDGRSKLDYVSFDDAGRGGRVVLRLWSGSAYIQTRSVRGAADVGLETPAAVVESRGRGLYRVDVRSGESRVSVFEGEADVVGDGGSERVRAGERSFARRGHTPRGSERFDVARAEDAFDQWNDERDTRSVWADGDSEYLPDDLDPYARELDPYGRWVSEPEVGFVWVPTVHSAWQPYSQGRWAWSPYGWTWLPNERWGWVTSHYGRWGYRPAVGWYWVPRSGWGPAWVSWGMDDHYVGWRPLGYHDKPVVFHGDKTPRHKGQAMPRGGWIVMPRDEMKSGKAVAGPRPPQHTFDEKKLVALDGAHSQPDREVAGVRPPGRAVPRNVSTRPGPGDTVPELRTDPATTIPFPVARRKPRTQADDRQPSSGSGSVRTAPHNRPATGIRHEDSGASAAGQAQPARPTAARPVSTPRETAPVQAAPRQEAPVQAAPREAPARPAGVGAPRARPRPIEKEPDVSSMPGVRPTAFFAAAEEKQPAPRTREKETDRDVLKRIFRPAEQGRDREKARKGEDQKKPPLVHTTPKPSERRSKKKDDSDR